MKISQHGRIVGTLSDIGNCHLYVFLKFKEVSTLNQNTEPILEHNGTYGTSIELKGTLGNSFELIKLKETQALCSRKFQNVKLRLDFVET